MKIHFNERPGDVIVFMTGLVRDSLTMFCATAILSIRYFSGFRGQLKHCSKKNCVRLYNYIFEIAGSID